MKYNRVFLVGFRTTGKSTIGKILAEKLGWSFWDMDFLITQEADESIDKLTKNGTDWKKFRKIENEILFEVSKLNEAVISCGGGVGVNDVIDDDTKKTFGELNKEVLKDSQKSLVVLLNSNEEKIRERLVRQYKNKKIMPFLNTKNAADMDEKDFETQIKKQVEDSLDAYKKRKPLYKELTDIVIDTDKESLENTAKEILEYVRK